MGIEEAVDEFLGHIPYLKAMEISQQMQQLVDNAEDFQRWYATLCLYDAQPPGEVKMVRRETEFYLLNGRLIANLVAGAIAVNEELKSADDATLKELQAQSELLAKYHLATLDIIYQHAEVCIKLVQDKNLEEQLRKL